MCEPATQVAERDRTLNVRSSAGRRIPLIVSFVLHNNNTYILRMHYAHVLYCIVLYLAHRYLHSRSDRRLHQVWKRTMQRTKLSWVELSCCPKSWEGSICLMWTSNAVIGVKYVDNRFKSDSRISWLFSVRTIVVSLRSWPYTFCDFKSAFYHCRKRFFLLTMIFFSLALYAEARPKQKYTASQLWAC